MNKKARKTKESSKKNQLKDRSSIKIASRGDLASFIGVETKKLSYILYKRDRKAAYRTIQIPKSNGKVRTLNAVQGPLKWLQRRTLDKLQAEYKPSGYAHGFVPGKSIITNSALHRRKKLIIKLDMENFFPSITFPRVRGMFMAPPFKFGREAATTMAQMACLDDETGALPQGGVLSPYVSNLLCRRLDKKLAIVAQDNNCRYSRYADDLTFSTNDVVNFKQKKFFRKVRKVVEKENFAINETKTRCLTRSDRQIVTGIVINDGVNVNRKYVRNIRAILYNCERDGIESQALRSEGYRDPRTSRFVARSGLADIVSSPSEKNRAETCKRFLWHLFGRLEFVRQVALSNGQKEQPDRYKRVILYKNLMFRFYKLIEKNSEYASVKRAALSRIENLPGGEDLIRGRDARDQIRRKSLDPHRDNFETKRRLKAVKSAQSIGQLEEEIKKWAINDPRFLKRDLGDDLNEAKADVAELVQYPAVDPSRTYRLLNSLKSTTGLGALTHDTDDFTLKKALELLNERFESRAYFLPKHLRDIIEKYRDKLEKATRSLGEDRIINVLEDPDIKDAAEQLKQSTRIGMDENETGIHEILDEAIRYAKRNCHPRDDVNLVKGKVVSFGFSTDVEFIEKALSRISHSMLENTRGSQIEVAASMEKTASEEKFDRYEITIRDNSDSNFEFDPLRDLFIGGKLTQAVHYTNGLCDFHLEADFNGQRASIDMHDGNKVQSCNIESKGVVHRLGFWISKPRVGEGKRRKERRPAARTLQRNGSRDLPQQTLTQSAIDGSRSSDSRTALKKVLILDIRNDRRNRLADAASQFGVLSVDDRSEISQENYEDANYDLVIVHRTNTESQFIETIWESPETNMVFYSGGYTNPLDDSGETRFGKRLFKASAKYIENEDNFLSLLEQALAP